MISKMAGTDLGLATLRRALRMDHGSHTHIILLAVRTPDLEFGLEQFLRDRMLGQGVANEEE
jgi:hypothetical protein